MPPKKPSPKRTRTASAKRTAKKPATRPRRKPAVRRAKPKVVHHEPAERPYEEWPHRVQEHPRYNDYIVMEVIFAGVLVSLGAAVILYLLLR